MISAIQTKQIARSLVDLVTLLLMRFLGCITYIMLWYCIMDYMHSGQ